MRKFLIILGVTAIAATLVSVDADARAGGPRSGAARYLAPKHGVDMRHRFNRELAKRLGCTRVGRPHQRSRWRCG
jgi:hypothetical protein